MIINLTHQEDLDGIASQAILKRTDPELVPFYADYPSFLSRLYEVEREAADGSQVVITDLGLSASAVDGMAAWAERLSRRASITSIDHHPLPQQARKVAPFVSFIIGADETCTAELVQLHYLPSDPVARRLAKYAKATDLGGENPDAFKIDKVVKADSSPAALDTLSTKLSRGTFWDEEMEAIYQGRLKLERTEIEELFSPDRLYEVEESGLKIAFSYSEVLHPEESAEKLSLSGFDLGVGVNPNLQNVVVYSSTSSVDLAELCQFLGGNGHRDRAGFPYAEPLVVDGRVSRDLVKNFSGALRNRNQYNPSI